MSKQHIGCMKEIKRTESIKRSAVNFEQILGCMPRSLRMVLQVHKKKTLLRVFSATLYNYCCDRLVVSTLRLVVGITRFRFPFILAGNSGRIFLKIHLFCFLCIAFVFYGVKGFPHVYNPYISILVKLGNL